MANYNSFADRVIALLKADPTPAAVAAGALALIHPITGAILASVARQGGALSLGDRADQIQVLAADGAITIKSGTVFVTKGTAAALTLAAPTTGLPADGGDDGKRLTIQSTTAAAHTVTQTTPGFNGGSTGSDVATFGAAIANSVDLIAYGGTWYTTGTPKGVTLG